MKKALEKERSSSYNTFNALSASSKRTFYVPEFSESDSTGSITSSISSGSTVSNSSRSSIVSETNSYKDFNDTLLYI